MKTLLQKLFGIKNKALSFTPTQFGQWIEEQHEEAHQKIKEQISKTAIEAQHWTAETTTAVQQLEKAQLINEAIPEQHKSMAQGNKHAFTTNVTNYLEQFRLPDQPEELSKWLLEYDKTTKEFLISTARQQTILQEFHAQETKAVLNNLREIEQLINKLKQILEKSKYNQLKHFLHQYNLCKTKEDKCTETTQELNALQKTIQKYQAEKKGLLQNQEKIANNEERILLQKKSDSVCHEIKQLEDKLRNMFSPLEAGLRKYAKLAPNHAHLVEQYLASPSDALSQDVHLKITTVLAELQKHAWSDTLELKQDKKARTITAIAELHKKFFQQTITTYAKLKRDEVHLAQELVNHTTSQQLNKLRQETEAVEQILKKKNTELKELQKKIAANKPEYESLVQEINEKIEVRISLVL